MPLKYRINIERKLVHVVGEGSVTFADLMGHIDALIADEEYVAPMLKLVDYRNSRMVPLTEVELDTFTDRKRFARDAFRGERCAIVSTNDLDFGISRMVGARVEAANLETRSFRDIDEAVAWLGVELADLGEEGD